MTAHQEMIFTYPVSHPSVLVSHLTLKPKVLASGNVPGVPDQLFAVTAWNFYSADIFNEGELVSCDATPHYSCD